MLFSDIYTRIVDQVGPPLSPLLSLLSVRRPASLIMPLFFLLFRFGDEVPGPFPPGSQSSESPLLTFLSFPPFPLIHSPFSRQRSSEKISPLPLSPPPPEGTILLLFNFLDSRHFSPICPITMLCWSPCPITTSDPYLLFFYSSPGLKPRPFLLEEGLPDHNQLDLFLFS